MQMETRYAVVTCTVCGRLAFAVRFQPALCALHGGRAIQMTGDDTLVITPDELNVTLRAFREQPVAPPHGPTFAALPVQPPTGPLPAAAMLPGRAPAATGRIVGLPRQMPTALPPPVIPAGLLPGAAPRIAILTGTAVGGVTGLRTIPDTVPIPGVIPGGTPRGGTAHRIPRTGLPPPVIPRDLRQPPHTAHAHRQPPARTPPPIQAAVLPIPAAPRVVTPPRAPSPRTPPHLPTPPGLPPPYGLPAAIPPRLVTPPRMPSPPLPGAPGFAPSPRPMVPSPVRTPGRAIMPAPRLPSPGLPAPAGALAEALNDFFTMMGPPPVPEAPFRPTPVGSPMFDSPARDMPPLEVAPLPANRAIRGIFMPGLPEPNLPLVLVPSPPGFLPPASPGVFGAPRPPRVGPSPVGSPTTCCVCADGTTDTLACTHHVCGACLPGLPKDTCPMCRAPLAGPTVTDAILAGIQARKLAEDAARAENERLMLEIAQLAEQRHLDNFNVNDWYELTNEQLVRLRGFIHRGRVPRIDQVVLPRAGDNQINRSPF